MWRIAYDTKMRHKRAIQDKVTKAIDTLVGKGSKSVISLVIVHGENTEQKTTRLACPILAQGIDSDKEDSDTQPVSYRLIGLIAGTEHPYSKHITRGRSAPQWQVT